MALKAKHHIVFAVLAVLVGACPAVVAILSQSWAGEMATLTARSAGTVTRVSEPQETKKCERRRVGGSTSYECWTLYSAAVEYSFEAGGEKVAGRGIGEPGAPLTDTDEARFKQALARYTEGARVTVSYDPADPAFACLDPVDPGDYAGMAYAFWGVAAAFLAAAFVFVAPAIRARRKRL